MKTIFMFMTATVVFTTVLLFSHRLNANAATYPKTIVGEITLVGERTLIIQDDNTQRKYELAASPNKLRDLITGYRVEVTQTDGRVISLTKLGMPMQTESTPYQRWKVIRSQGE
ncbi:MAG TPA: hypothetical protein VH878_09945 [Thermodesulfobacteriota bacterium]|jgi:hypothetical protein